MHTALQGEVVCLGSAPEGLIARAQIQQAPTGLLRGGAPGKGVGGSRSPDCELGWQGPLGSKLKEGGEWRVNSLSWRPTCLIHVVLMFFFFAY